MQDFFKGLAAIPAIGSLLYALFLIFQSEAEHKKQKYLQRQQQIFNLASTSHMANVSFDKHVEFCERYMEEVHNTVSTLFREGPTHEALKHSDNLFNIKVKYAAWIPKDIAATLEPFENALRKIGALAGREESSRRTAVDLSTIINKMYETFEEVLSIDKLDQEHSEIAVEEVKQRIRAIMGIDELTKMRRMLIKEALEFLEKSD